MCVCGNIMYGCNHTYTHKRYSPHTHCDVLLQSNDILCLCILLSIYRKTSLNSLPTYCSISGLGIDCCRHTFKLTPSEMSLIPRYQPRCFHQARCSHNPLNHLKWNRRNEVVCDVAVYSYCSVLLHSGCQLAAALCSEDATSLGIYLFGGLFRVNWTQLLRITVLCVLTFFCFETVVHSDHRRNKFS